MHCLLTVASRIEATVNHRYTQVKILSLLVLPPGKEMVAVEALGALPKGIVKILCLGSKCKEKYDWCSC